MLVLEKGSILIAYADNSLILHQNLISGSFLKVGCNVVFETISVIFFYSSTLKSNSLSCTVNAYFTHA